MKRFYCTHCFSICFACILVSALPVDAQQTLGPRKAQPSVSPNPSSTKVQLGNQALAVQVCDRLVNLKERARSINRSFGEYLKLDGEMSEIYPKSQAHLTQATKEQLPQSKTIAGTVNKASPGQIGGVVTKERGVGQSPEVRRMRDVRDSALYLRDKIVGGLRVRHQEMSSVASDLAKLPGGGLVPAESKQCLKRASAQIDSELSRMKRISIFSNLKKGPTA